MGIGKGCALRDPEIGSRFMIGGSRTDENILVCPPLKQSVIPFHLFRNKTYKLSDHIKMDALYRFQYSGFVIDIRYDRVNAIRKYFISVPAV